MVSDEKSQVQRATDPDTAVLTKPFAEISAKLHLLLHTGQLLMESGADSDRTVRDMMRTAAYMGIPEDRIHQHVMYTTLMLNVNDETHSYTEFRKCKKHGINMTALSAVSKLTWRALAKNYTLEEFEQQLMAIRERPRNYPFWLTALGAGAACGGFCKLFGGSWLDFLLTASVPSSASTSSASAQTMASTSMPSSPSPHLSRPCWPGVRNSSREP
mgnify:CR=1 FL=1